MKYKTTCPECCVVFVVTGGEAILTIACPKCHASFRAKGITPLDKTGSNSEAILEAEPPLPILPLTPGPSFLRAFASVVVILLVIGFFGFLGCLFTQTLHEPDRRPVINYFVMFGGAGGVLLGAMVVRWPFRDRSAIFSSVHFRLPRGKSIVDRISGTTQDRNVLIASISIGVFVAALFAPAITMYPLDLNFCCIGDRRRVAIADHPWDLGVTCFLLAWVFPYGGLSIAAWMGNPFLFASWVLFMARFWTAALVGALIAVILASLAVVMCFLPSGRQGFAADSTMLTGLGPGFYFWISRMAIVAFACFLNLRTPKPT